MRLMSRFRPLQPVSALLTDEIQSVDAQLSDMERPSEIAVDDPMLGMAIRNEAVRQDFADLMGQFHKIDSLKAKFTEIVTRFSAVVDELESSRRETSEFQIALNIENSRVEELREHIAKIEPELSSLIGANASLHSQVKQLTQKNENLLSQLENEKLSKFEALETLAERSEALNVANAKISALEDERSTARIEIDKLIAELASKDIELEKTASALRHIEEQDRVSRTMLQEASAQNARLSRQASELEPLVERYKSQIAQLQVTLDAERHAKEQASIDRIEGLELLRTELNGANTKLEAASARAETNERLLNDVRANYREKLEELRGSERRVIDLSMQIANMQRRVETAEKESEGVFAKLSALETERRHYTAQLDALSKALADKDTEIVLANDRTTFVTARLEESQRFLHAERERFEADLVTITQLFDKERVDRTMLEGALKSARRYGQQLSRELYDGAEIEGQVEEMAIAIEADLKRDIEAVSDRDTEHDEDKSDDNLIDLTFLSENTDHSAEVTAEGSDKAEDNTEEGKAV